MRVVLTREAGRNDGLRAWLPAQCVVDEVPLTTTTYRDERDVALELAHGRYFGSFVALVVTSARASRYAQLARSALSPHAQILSVGPATTAALAGVGIAAHFEADARAADLGRYVHEGPVLVVGAAEMREELLDDFAQRHVVSVRCEVYRTRGVHLDASAKAKISNTDVLFIGAPSAWRQTRVHVSPTTWVVVPGSSTGEVVRREHERVLEGWSIELRDTLAALEDGPDETTFEA